MSESKNSRRSFRSTKSRLMQSAAAAGVAMLAGQKAGAADYSWNVPTGPAAWDNAASWTLLAGTGGGFPNAIGGSGVGDAAVFGSVNGTNTVNVTFANTISLGAPFSSTNTQGSQLLFSNTNSAAGYNIGTATNTIFLDDGSGNGFILSSSTNAVANQINSQVTATNTLLVNITAGSLFMQQQVNATTLTKQGAGTLKLGNSGFTGTNAISVINLSGGVLTASQGPNGGSLPVTGNSLGNAVINVLATGTTLNPIADNNFTVGNLINFTSPVGTAGATFTILADRAANTNATGKTLTFSLLNLGSTAGLSTINANANNAYVQTWSNVTARGNLSLVNAGTLNIGTLNEAGTSASILKSGAGSINLTGANSFSGGLTVTAGAINANAAGSLGNGTIQLLTSSNLVLNAANAFKGTGNINAGSSAIAYNVAGAGNNSGTGTGTLFVSSNQSRITLGTSVTSVGLDRFSADAGSSINISNTSQVLGGALNAGFGTNTGPVNLFLATGATLAEQSAGLLKDGSGAGLGTNALYFFGLAQGQSITDSVTVGSDGVTPTPWKGLAGDRSGSSRLANGTVTALSDFTIQAGAGAFGNAFSLGNGTTVSNISIIDGQAGAGGTARHQVFLVPVNVNPTSGTNNNFILDSATANYSGVSQFVASNGATILLNQNNAMGGSGASNAATITNIQLLSGASLNLLSTSPAAINGNVTINAGGSLLLDDNNGLTGTGVITVGSGAFLTLSKDLVLTGPQSIIYAQGLQYPRERLKYGRHLQLRVAR